MSLYTNCYRRASDSDGLKISIMRFTPKNFSYDVWIPELAPTPELLKIYREKRINWQEYEEGFLHLMANNSGAIDRLIQLATKQDVTIYCSEFRPERCHRRLVAEEVIRREPQLHVGIR